MILTARSLSFFGNQSLATLDGAFKTKGDPIAATMCPSMITEKDTWGTADMQLEYRSRQANRLRNAAPMMQELRPYLAYKAIARIDPGM